MVSKSSSDQGSASVLHTTTYESIADAVGNTPMVKLSKLAPADHATVFVKLEFNNPLASVKDRIGKAMIDAGARDGLINRDTHIIEPTSGNTGIALAFVCAARGYRLTLTMPESMSLERRALLRQLGAELVLTPAAAGMSGAIEKAHELSVAEDNTFLPQQFDNPANPDIHEATTGPEIWAASGANIDAVVAGVGTGGTITGTTRYIRQFNASFQAFAVEPTDSPVISGGDPGPHKIQGIGAGFVPKNLDTSLLSGVETVTNDEAFAMARRLAKHEGILGGISTGANVTAALRVAARPEFRGKRIVTIAASFGERYLSTALFEKTE